MLQGYAQSAKLMVYSTSTCQVSEYSIQTSWCTMYAEGRARVHRQGTAIDRLLCTTAGVPCCNRNPDYRAQVQWRFVNRCVLLCLRSNHFVEAGQGCCSPRLAGRAPVRQQGLHLDTWGWRRKVTTPMTLPPHIEPSTFGGAPQPH